MSDEPAPKRRAGGVARAKSLTAEQRKDIASRAATTRWADKKGIPRATHEGDLKIGDRVIACAVIDGGQRLLSERTVTKALGGKRGGSHWKRLKEGGANLPVYMSAKNLKPFISKELELALTPVLYLPQNGGAVAHGQRAETLPLICNMFLSARDAGKLLPSQYAIAEQADILMRGFAEVGIVALVDEATGFQRDRARDGLQLILDAFLRKSFAAWSKRIPDQFYEQIYRLRGWEWPGMQKNRFQVVGKYTSDLIYKRLAPGVQEELDRINPKNTKGNRAHKHHQWLTEEIGHPALSAHMHAVLGLMRAAKSWVQFKSMINDAFPIIGSEVQIELDLPPSEED